MTVRQKKCRICKEWFKPRYSTLQPVCNNPKCILEFKKQQDAKKRKAQTKQMREALYTYSTWLKKLQVVFNKYIRERDKAKGCISCGRSFSGKYDAGHFYSVGSHPELRFDEDNVHGQCVYCNQHKHGSIAEYSEGLEARIGVDRLKALRGRRGQNLKLSIPEIKEEIERYKQKIKKL